MDRGAALPLKSVSCPLQRDLDHAYSLHLAFCPQSLRPSIPPYRPTAQPDWRSLLEPNEPPRPAPALYAVSRVASRSIGRLIEVQRHTQARAMLTPSMGRGCARRRRREPVRRKSIRRVIDVRRAVRGRGLDTHRDAKPWAGPPGRDISCLRCWLRG